MQRIVRRAKKEDKVIVRKPSSFMKGVDVFLVPEGFILPKYKEPSKKLPNGCETYQKYFVSWMMEIPNKCCC